ncbi:MAG: SRPBCC family protein [Candidatus Ranarchaeia archaeon]
MGTYSKSIIVNTDIAEVWALISDLPRFSKMLPQVTKVEWASEKTRGVGIKSKWYPKHRPDIVAVEEVVEYQPPYVFGWISKRPKMGGKPESGFMEVNGRFDFESVNGSRTKVTFSEVFPDRVKDLSRFEKSTTQELNTIKEFFDKKEQPRQVVIASSKLIQVSPEKLFSEIRDVKKLSELVPDANCVEVLSSSSVGKGTRSKWGSQVLPGTWYYQEITEFEENRELGWVTIGMEEELLVKGCLGLFETPNGDTVICLTEKFMFSLNEEEIKARLENINNLLTNMEKLVS